jgi:hypothetical protein
MELDTKVSGASTVREEAIEACRALFNGSSKHSYFERRGIVAETLKRAGVGYETGTFTYPCVRKSGGFLAIPCKSEGRDESGKRRQWWKGYADDLPPKGHGKRPDEPAKVIPFGLETLGNLEPGSPVVLCCGEDALSLRQMGYTALSQPGAGLLEPVYAREFAGFEVVVFYDAGEEREARKDALKLLEARAREVRIIEWPAAAENGADVNGRLVEDPEGFAEWATRMIANAKALSSVGADHPKRDGQLDMYFTPPEPYGPSVAEVRRQGVPRPPRRDRQGDGAA